MRSLSSTEIAEARHVFGAGLDYTRARVWDNTPWPNWIADIGATLHRYRRTWDNAVTLGDVCYFPVGIRTAPDSLAQGEIADMAWLIHELTHQWQFQRLGWRYLARALGVQIREGLECYNYQGAHPTREAALRAAHAEGRRLRHFNLEQQGDLARDYYLALRQNRDPGPWEPFIAEFRETGKRESVSSEQLPVLGDH